MPKHIKDELCKDWCDTLSVYTLAEVSQGIRDLFEASRGRLRSINEFQVKEQIEAAHRRQVAAMPRVKAQDQRGPVELTPQEREERQKILGDLVNGLKAKESK